MVRSCPPFPCEQLGEFCEHPRVHAHALDFHVASTGTSGASIS